MSYNKTILVTAVTYIVTTKTIIRTAVTAVTAMFALKCFLNIKIYFAVFQAVAAVTAVTKPADSDIFYRLAVARGNSGNTNMGGLLP